MAKLTIEIELDNSAFSPEVIDFELSSLLRKIANKVENNGTDYLADYPLHDTNGGHCGICTLDMDKDPMNVPGDYDCEGKYHSFDLQGICTSCGFSHE